MSQTTSPPTPQEKAFLRCKMVRLFFFLSGLILPRPPFPIFRKFRPDILLPTQHPPPLHLSSLTPGPLSFTNDSVQYPDVAKTYFPEFGEFSNVYGQQGFVDVHDICPGTPLEFTCEQEGAAANGTGASPVLCDLVHYVDAARKLHAAAEAFNRTGKPFALFVGIRQPHLDWRLAPHYVDLYKDADVPLPVHNTLDESIDTIAYTAFTPLYNFNPHEPLPKDWVRFIRQRWVGRRVGGRERS